MTRTDSVSARARWAIAGLVLFLIVDAVLVGWALSVDRGSGSAAAPRGPGSVSASPEPTTSAASEPAAAPARVLSVLDEDTAWRSTVGACPGTAPVLEVTTDGGRTWRPSDLAGIAGVAGVAAVQITDEDVASVVALDARSCEPVLALTYVAGRDWVAYPERVSGTWFVDPAAPALVHSPAGAMAAPCSAVVSLAPRSADGDDAAALCADHSVYRTDDGGETWSEPVAVPGSVAVAAGDADYLVATTGTAGCDGVGVASLPDEATAAGEATCAAPDAARAGEVALAEGGGSAWLWAGDAVVTSVDGGTTWR